MSANGIERIAVKIRRVRSEDLDRLIEIERDSFLKDAFTQRFLGWLVRRLSDCFLVAEINGQIAGYAVGYVKSQINRVGRVYSVAVDPNFRHKGIGQLLIDSLVDHLTTLGADSVELEVSAQNPNAIRLYTKMGFQIVDNIRNYYRDKSDAHRMVKHCLSPLAGRKIQSHVQQNF